MKFALLMPTDRMSQGDEFVSAEGIAEMARTAERAGFDSVSVTEHPIPGDHWLEHGGHHALDPFVALSFAAAATSKIRIKTNLVVLPYRNPFLCAKSVASLDTLSRGRLIFAVGAGYLESEFAALGVDFSKRNELMDEYLQVMKQIWSEGHVQFQGTGYHAEGNSALPFPVQKPHPPIFIGGNSKRAIRRVIEHADGWMPMYAPARRANMTHSALLETLDDLSGRLAYAREYAEKVGRRDPFAVTFVSLVPSLDEPGYDRSAFLDHIAEQAKRGVSTMQVLVTQAQSRAEVLDFVERYGAEIIDEVGETTS